MVSANLQNYGMLIVDDDEFMRGFLVRILSGLGAIDISTASNGTQAIRCLDSCPRGPDIILCDLNMPEMDGIEALKKLREQNISSRIVMFTVSDQEDDVVAALRAGADGYLLKDMEPEDMIKQLHQAAVGKMVISERLTALLAEALRSNKPQQASRPDFDSLTPREKDILRLIAEGLSNKMIGRKLDISDGTVKVHVKHLLKKLNLRSRVEVAVWAVEEGLHKG